MQVSLVSKMDDWVIESIKHENNAIYEIIKHYRKLIETGAKNEKEIKLEYPDVS